MKQAVTIEYEPHDYGWAAGLPLELGTLFGLPLTIDIATRHIPSEPADLPAIHERQQSLIGAILERIGPILREAEGQLEGYYSRASANFEEIRPILANPKVWIPLADTEDLRRPRPREDNKWTLVVCLESAPDFGHHIEFDLDQCIEVWAGD